MRGATFFALFAILAATFTLLGDAATKPKPWQWTTAQARAALMAQKDGLMVETGSVLHPRATSASCRGRGPAVAGRYTGFVCNTAFSSGARLLFAAKTRRAGGLCWSVVSSPIPSGCLAKGARVAGDAERAKIAMTRVAGTLNQGFYCLANGAGFFTCSWITGDATHHGTVIFTPSGTRAKVIS